MPAPVTGPDATRPGIRPNRLRELLRAGQGSIGTHVHVGWPNVVELLGKAGGFDYVEFSGEYVAYDLKGLDDFCRAAELAGLGAIVELVELADEDHASVLMPALGRALRLASAPAP